MRLGSMKTIVLALMGLSWIGIPGAMGTGPLPASNPDKSSPANIISGKVRDGNAGVPGAVVRIQTQKFSTISDADGSFRIALPETASGTLKLTAWAKGFYIGGPIEVIAGQDNADIVLHRHHEQDDATYRWLPSTSALDPDQKKACATCHSGKGTELEGLLPVDLWLLDAHSQSAMNPRFLSMYSGTNLAGKRGKPRRYIHTKDYGTFPLPPEDDDRDTGPGYRLDFPETRGNCATCHAPMAAGDAPYETDPSALQGVSTEGINCDFCHKVWDVRLDPVTGMPYEDRPGVLSIKFRRPFAGHQFFAGPLDDVAPGEDTFSPLQRMSQFCAPCHFGVFWDTVVYNSFGEWLESTYSDPQNGKTCQDCHMPHIETNYFVRPEKGGLKRDPRSIFSHRMPGARDEDLLANAATMETVVERSKTQIGVRVTVINDNTGHHIPTDSPLRHVILLVQAKGEDGSKLELVDGPTLPEWCGKGDPAQGYYAGLPGKVFAKVLEEAWTSVTPTAAYWNPTRVVADTRLAAFAKDTSTYSFLNPCSGSVTIEVSLLYRRAYKVLMDRKGWNTPDIMMNRQLLLAPPLPTTEMRSSGEETK
jgi:hypothetical protein